MTGTQFTTAAAIFTDRGAVQRAIDELLNAGFNRHEIGIAHRGEKTPHTPESGRVFGGLWDSIASVFSSDKPSTTSAPGHADYWERSGGLVAGLNSWGIAEPEARALEQAVQAGDTLVLVRADGRGTQALDILRRHGGSVRGMISEAGMTSAATCATTGAAAATARPVTGHTTTETERTIPVRAEELHVQKKPVQAGEVSVRKEVVTEHKTIDVPVQREEVVIERHPVSGRPASNADFREKQEEIRIPITEEQVTVEKQPKVVEEVTVGKRRVQEDQQVGATVRKEQVQVNRQGNVDVRTNDPNLRDKTKEKTPAPPIKKR